MRERALARSRPSVVNFELRDADEIAEHFSQRFSPVEIEREKIDEPFGMSGTYGIFGGIDFSQTWVEGDFKIVPKQLHDRVFFTLPTAGSLVLHQDRDAIASSSTVAVAGEGTACRSVEFRSGCIFYAVVIERPTLAARLSALIGRPVIERPVFQSSLDIVPGGASPLMALVRCITSPEFGPQLSRASRTAERIRDAVVDLVLETWPNSYSEILHRPPPMIAPQHVKRAMDFIHDDAGTHPSGAELAALSGVSIRALQAGFRRFVGVSISSYQRQIRLERARADLLREPTISVENIASRWGFSNAGRFSRYFRNAYGILPTELVRRKH